MSHAQVYIVAGGALAAGIIALAWVWFKSQRAGGGRIVAIVATVAFDSRGVTDGKSLAMGWNELEKVTLANIKDGEAPGAVLLQLSGNGKTVFIARTAAGWDDLFERLASLPGADPSSFETARVAVTPGCGLALNIWEKNPGPSGPPMPLVVSSGSKPALMSYLSQTLIRWIPGENAFELARFDKDPANVTERLIVPYPSLDGFRFWWRGSVLMSGWRDFDDQRVPKVAPPTVYYCLQIWPDDPRWAAFQIDLAHDATGEQLDPVLANLAVDWYGRLGSALNSDPASSVQVGKEAKNDMQPSAFEPPTLVDAGIVLTPAADARAVLAQVARVFFERFSLLPNFWQLSGDERTRREGTPTIEMIASLSPADLADSFYADGPECGGIYLTRFTPQPHDYPFWETYGLKDCWGLRLISPDISVEQNPDRVFRSLASRVEVVRTLIEQRFPVVRAHVRRSGTTFAPIPPHAEPSHALFIADRAEIERDYVDPNVYWSAWEHATELGEGRVLLTRALEVVDEVEYKRRTYPAAWALARAARPGLTNYAFHQADELTPGERVLFDSGESTLTQLGYHPEEQWIEFTAMVPDSAHILPREVFLLEYLVWRKRVPDGRPLQSVRVTFPNRVMAEREAGLLHDIGVTVQYFSEVGTWEVLAR